MRFLLALALVPALGLAAAGAEPGLEEAYGLLSTRVKKEKPRADAFAQPGLAYLGRQVAALKEKARREGRVFDADAPIIVAKNHDAFQPYRVVEACPQGQTAVVVDWPRPGDKMCQGALAANKVFERPGYEYLGAQMKALKEAAQREGGYFDENDPLILVRSDDAFAPYRIVARCPAGTSPAVVDWPRPGDMLCE